MGTFFETTVRLIAPGSNALVRALAVRIQVSSRFLCSTNEVNRVTNEVNRVPNEVNRVPNEENRVPNQ